MIDFERIFRERIGVEQFLMMAGRNDVIANHVTKYGEMHHWSHEQMAVAVARAWYEQLTFLMGIGAAFKEVAAASPNFGKALAEIKDWRTETGELDIERARHALLNPHAHDEL